MTTPDPGPIDIDPDARRIRVLWWLVCTLLAIGLGACLAKGADRPADPFLAPGTIAFRVEGASRVEGGPTPAEHCALLAATAEERAAGLMHVTDLGRHAGMVFLFDEDTTAHFHMANTMLPLSIAFFTSDGAFVGALDMAPCPDGQGCPTYAPPAAYRTALEVPQGTLAALGIGPGARLVLGGGCSASG